MSKRKSHTTPHFSPYIFPLAVLGIITLGVAAWYSIPRIHPLSINQIINNSGLVELRLDPDARTITPGTEQVINLQASTEASKLTGVQIELTYDSVCGTPTVSQGSFFPNVIVAPKVENGKINFTFGAPLDSGGVTGFALNFASITIKPTTIGDCHLTFTDNNLVTIIGSEENAVHTLTSSTITVAAAQASAAASANPSAAASAAPSQKPDKPTGLRSNCYNGGTRATFRWDSVAGITSYKFRLDQKNGTNDKSVDNIGATQYDTDLLAGQEYTWWVHSTKDGLDSDEARVDSLTCPKTNPTASPTPSPTPKPSIKASTKPTPTPSVKPTPTPTTSAGNLSSSAPSSSGSLNDVFGGNLPSNSPEPTAKPGFFQMIALGWQAIFATLAKLFQ